MIPHPIAVDNYFVNREDTPRDKDGNYNYECLEAIDVKQFNQDLTDLLEGKEVALPIFNFKTGRREWTGHKLCLSSDSVIIVEGLHGLNPVLLPQELDQKLVFKMFVSPLLPLNLDLHNRIPSSYLRPLRRIVRDYQFRGTTPEKTLAMWDSVRAGEEKWIFPYHAIQQIRAEE